MAAQVNYGGKVYSAQGTENENDLMLRARQGVPDERYTPVLSSYDRAKAVYTADPNNQQTSEQRSTLFKNLGGGVAPPADNPAPASRGEDLRKKGYTLQPGGTWAPPAPTPVAPTVDPKKQKAIENAKKMAEQKATQNKTPSSTAQTPAVNTPTPPAANPSSSPSATGIDSAKVLASATPESIQAAKDAGYGNNPDDLAYYLTTHPSSNSAPSNATAAPEVSTGNQNAITHVAAGSTPDQEASRQGVVADLLNQGVTDPKQIVDAVNYDDKGNKIGDFTISEVQNRINKAKEANPLPNPYNFSLSQVNYAVLSDPNATSGQILAEQAKLAMTKYQMDANAASRLEAQIAQLENQSRQTLQYRDNYLNLMNQFATENKDLIGKNKDLSLNVLKSEQDKITAQETDTMADLSDKRSRLEGYMKAQLAMAGTLDGSYGLNELTTTVSKYDKMMTSVQIDFNGQLADIANRQNEVNLNYTSDVVKINQSLLTNTLDITKQTNDQLNAIENNETLLANEIATKKDQAYLDFQVTLSGLASKAREDANTAKKESLKLQNDIALEGIKASGGVPTYNKNTGEVTALADADGNMILNWDAQQKGRDQTWEKQKFQIEGERDITGKIFSNLPKNPDEWYSWSQSMPIAINAAVNSGQINQATGQYLLQQVRTANTVQTDAYGDYQSSQPGYEPGMTYAQEKNLQMCLDQPWDTLTPEQRTNCVLGARAVFGANTVPWGLTSYQDKVNIINSKTAMPGEMAVINTGNNIGHVAVVTGVNQDGTVNIFETNYGGGGDATKKSSKVGTRTGTPQQLGIVGYYAGSNLTGQKESSGVIGAQQQTQGKPLSSQNERYAKAVAAGEMKVSDIKATEHDSRLATLIQNRALQINEEKKANTGLKGAYKNAFGSVLAQGFSKEERAGNTEEINRLLDDGDTAGAKNLLLRLSLDRADAATRATVEGREDAIAAVNELDGALQRFASKGGKTGLISGNVEDFYNNVLKTTKNPELAGIANDITLAVQSYRKAISGAAFTPSEAEEYKSVFPSEGKSPELNRAKIDSLKRVFGRNQDNFYRRQMGDTNFKELFPSGVYDFRFGQKANPAIAQDQQGMTALNKASSVASKGAADLFANQGKTMIRDSQTGEVLYVTPEQVDLFKKNGEKFTIIQ